MSFDGFFTHHIVNELNTQLAGGRISKIHQPYPNEIILVMRSQGKNHKLLLSAHPNFARIQLTKIPYDNPNNPPNFCMMLRKYLENAILDKIEQIENDRVIHFYFSRRNELGDLEDIVLIAELMGRHSTLVLVNQATGKILDCIKHLGPSQNSYRLLLPGTQYIAPPNTNKLNPFTLEKTQLFDVLSTFEEITPKHIQETFQGIGMDTANEFSYQLLKNPNDKLATWQELITRQTHPLWYQGPQELFSAIPFDYLESEGRSFDNLSELLENYYSGKAERDRVKQQASELIKKMNAETKRNKKKIKILEKERLDTEKADDYRIKGELLTSYLHLIKPGMSTITLDNYYDNNQSIEIKLDARLSPSHNAQKYYKKYNKLKNGAKQIESQLSLAKQEQLYLESIISQLDLASPSDIKVIREELIASHYVKNRQKKIKKQQPSKPEIFWSREGDEILVGRNNLQNDQLTFKIANKTDIWLHAKDIPGSHVIIKNAHPSEQTLEDAAILAAYHSKFRLSSQVPIDYVAAKFVHKPNGAKPGFVIYENQRTLYVTPDSTLVEQLKNKPT